MSSPGNLRAPLLWLLLPFAAGLALADARPASAGELKLAAAIATGAALVAVVLQRRERPGTALAAHAALLVAGLVCGYAWLPLRSPPRLDWTLPPREVNVVLEIEQLFSPLPHRKTFSGLARVVSADGPAGVIQGQRVYFTAIRRISVLPEISGHYRFRGVLEPVPFGSNEQQGFHRYLDSLGIRLRLMRGHLHAEVKPPTAFRQFCTRAQDRLVGILRHGLDAHPEIVSLYQAMLLGEKAVLNAEQQSAFMRSGVFHVFTVSGLHVGVIAIAILGGLILLRVPRRAAAVAGLAVLWLYVQVTGGNTPAERAFMMIAFFTSAQMFRLPGNPLAALAAAALTTLLLEPRQLFTTGFQMSYSVVTALIVMGAPLANHWKSRWMPWRDLPETDWRPWQLVVRYCGQKILLACGITWAAILASTPSSIGNFGLFSPGALLGNLLIVPLASLAIVAGFISLLVGLAGLTVLSQVFNHAAGLLITIMDAAVRRGSSWPGVYFEADFHAAWMTAGALVIVIGTMLLGASRRWRGPGGYWLPLMTLALVMILGVKFR